MSMLTDHASGATPAAQASGEKVKPAKIAHQTDKIKAPQPPIQQKNTFRFHSLLPQKSELALLFSFVRLGASPTAAVGLSCVSHLRSCPQRLCFLVDPWLPEVDRSVHLHEMLSNHLQNMTTHSKVLDAFVSGLTKGMPGLIHERWPPSTVSHVHGVDEGAQHTCFFPSQCQLICSFPYHRFAEVCQYVDWDCGCCHDHGHVN